MTSTMYLPFRCGAFGPIFWVSGFSCLEIRVNSDWLSQGRLKRESSDVTLESAGATNQQLRKKFLRFSAVFLLGMAALAAGLSLLAGLNPLHEIDWSWRAAGTGAAAAVLMIGVFSVARRERELATDILGAHLAACRWYDLVLLALFVGCCEEWLFRGVLEPWLARWSPWGAFVLVNALFGTLHAVSPTYAVLAGMLGAAMSLLARYPEFNLLRPIVAHALYDLMGFLWIVAEYRRSPAARKRNGDHEAQRDLAE